MPSGVTRCLAAFFRLPPRAVDVFSLLLMSAGINLSTRAVGNVHPVQMLIAGSSIIVSGITFTFLRYRSEQIWHTAKSNLETENNKVLLYITGGLAAPPKVK